MPMQTVTAQILVVRLPDSIRNNYRELKRTQMSFVNWAFLMSIKCSFRLYIGKYCNIEATEMILRQADESSKFVDFSVL